MELSKKTTILFTHEQHERLVKFAERRGVSLGELVRSACLSAYGLADSETRLAAARALAGLALPVGDPSSMKRESQPSAGDLLP